ncbi:SAF domain protein [Desulfofundulus kuznetsovii DSM 6115]|uniref:SAF domain protein n=1 Tax=Desulfofundulus kuznetsovii (strain DSM 6115 / VKM B-1805 / 17) TaxID=760568 RepID=A0AAU8PD81_DESK7|nr:SAF domain protein [Desulfofundulus kuznetsovii DSM 6115]
MVLRFSFLKRTWPYLLAVTVGLAVATFSFNALKREASSQEGIKLPVAARDLPPYTQVQAQDLGWGTFPAELPGAVKAPAEAVGKVVTTAAPKDHPLRVSELKDPESLDVQLVSVNIDSSRLGGARPGDLVDVYWIQPAEKSAWTPGTGATLVARDARMVSVLDKNGQPVDSGQGLVAATVQGAAVRAPAIAVLAVKAEEVRAIIPGAASNNTCIVLVRKFKAGGDQVGDDAGGQGHSAPQAPAKSTGSNQ